MTYLSFIMIKFRSYSSHYLTEAFQIVTHILDLDSLLFLQKLSSTIHLIQPNTVDRVMVSHNLQQHLLF